MEELNENALAERKEQELKDVKWREERAELRRKALLEAASEDNPLDEYHRPDPLLIRRESAEIHHQEVLLIELKERRAKLEERKKLIRQESAELHHQELLNAQWREERMKNRRRESVDAELREKRAIIEENKRLTGQELAA